jgi:hypothetical protein
MNQFKLKVEFNIRTLLSLEEELNMSLYDILFESEIDNYKQTVISAYGLSLTEEELRDYLQLDTKHRLSLDLMVNASILDAFGLGKQHEEDYDDSDNETDTFDSFKEYIKSVQPYVLGVVGLSLNDFYSLTPYEVTQVIQAHRNYIEQTYQLQKIACINAIGLTRSKKFKEINPFDTKSNKRVKKVDIDKKNEELDFLKGR